MKKILYTLLIFIIVFLTGCANAGKDQKVVSGDTVTLDGNASVASLHGKLEKYKWRQVKGKKVTLSDINSVHATFIAPVVTKHTQLVFKLKTTEIGGYFSPFSTQDLVSIIVKPSSSENKAPHAVATVSSSIIKVNEPLTFDANQSSDSDGEIVGYKWVDEANNTLSESVHFIYTFTTVGEKNITLYVTDDDGQIGQVSVSVTVKEALDITKPVITLLGNAEVNLTVGEVYTDVGATATDNVDGNITDKIVMHSDVNSAKVGTYTVTYDVNDSAGNVADRVRRVIHIIEDSELPESMFVYEGHYYEMVKSALSWQDASTLAHKKGGYLTHISSQAENDMIYSHLQVYITQKEYANTVASNGGGAAYVWIGANDLDKENIWRWEDDNTHFWTGRQNGKVINHQFINWGIGQDNLQHEPDNASNQDAAGIALTQWPLHSGTLGHASQWNDLIATDALYYVIEYNQNPNKNAFEMTMLKSTSGITLASIKDNNIELLNQSTDLFSLSLRNVDNNISKNITASSGWQEIDISTVGTNQIITLSNPINNLLPSTLKTIVTISTENHQSQWDLSVVGIGEHYSLMDVEFPRFNIKASGEDDFFLPYHFGRVVHNPATEIELSSFNGLYPRGFGATMQYLAYYNANYGLYFGFHDPKATLKSFYVQNENAGVTLGCHIPIPNKTVANNSWEMPGKFELDFYHGDWYDAALKYKEWVYKNAAYRPVDTVNRLARQAKVGTVAVWGTDDIFGNGSDIVKVEKLVKNFKDFFDIPVGVHWIGWYNKPHDTDFPEIFPELVGLNGVSTRLKKSYGNDLFLDAYMNGRLYDSTLGSYDPAGKADTAKDSLGHPYVYNDDSPLRIMCPTQIRWKNTMVDSVSQITSRMGLDGVYIDQVTAASPKECMDITHTHTLGGGSYWRDGYKEMFHTMHETIPEGKFIISEGANDFLVDEVDVFLTEQFVVDGQVPAFQVVYGGKVQFIGPATGTSTYANTNEPDSQKFYGRLAQSFGFGVIPGRFYMTIVNQGDRRVRAANYLRRLARVHSKLKDYFSFGEMKKPLNLHGNIPTIMFDATKRNAGINMGKVVIPAIQTSTWSNGESIVVTVVNGKVPETADESITFSFDFDASRYGLNGTIKIKEITENSDGTYQNIASQFTKTVTLRSYEVKVFVITSN